MSTANKAKNWVKCELKSMFFRGFLAILIALIEFKLKTQFTFIL